MTNNITAFKTVRRPSVVEEVIEGFKQAIMAGQLRPGQRLPTEHELARQFGVGRSAIREAMKMLEAMGVVTIQQGDGTYMTDKPSASLVNPVVLAVMMQTGSSTELRTLIKTAYCQLASEKATPEDWERIMQAQKRWEDSINKPERDTDTLTSMDLDFHYAVLEATHNPFIIRLGRAIEELFFASVRTTLAHMEWLFVAVGGHRGILEAMRTRDPELIRRAVVRSLEAWGKAVEAQQEREQRAAEKTDDGRFRQPVQTALGREA